MTCSEIVTIGNLLKTLDKNEKNYPLVLKRFQYLRATQLKAYNELGTIIGTKEKKMYGSDLMIKSSNYNSFNSIPLVQRWVDGKRITISKSSDRALRKQAMAITNHYCNDNYSLEKCDSRIHNGFFNPTFFSYHVKPGFDIRGVEIE